jgi:hypothetical protein
MRALRSVTGELMLALDNDDQGVSETYRLIHGKRMTPRRKDRPMIPWAAKFPELLVFNYGDSTAKDPGEMNDEEIEWGIENATPALEWEP